MMIRLLAFKDYSGSCFVYVFGAESKGNICSVLFVQGLRDPRSGLSLPSFTHIYSNSVTRRDGSGR